MEHISWGRYGWGFIHNVALGYSETPTHSEKENYKLFFIVKVNVKSNKQNAVKIWLMFISRRIKRKQSKI